MLGLGRRPTPVAPAAATPLLGGIAGAVLQNVIARRLATRILPRAGGLPGMVLGMAASYAIDRYFQKRAARR